MSASTCHRWAWWAGAMDRTMLFRVAEATLKDFLDGVGRALMSPTAGPPRHRL